MRQSANRLRKVPEAPIASLAQTAARGAPKSSEARSIPLDLKPLIAPYRKHRRLTFRIENLPQLARLSAGQNNGDHTWSLALDELDGLFYFPPEGFDKEHTLAVRVVTKDETGASTIALIDFRITGADDRENEPLNPALRGAAQNQPIEMPQDRVLREEILALKATLAERDAELNRMLASGEQANTHWQQKLDEALLGAESIWRHDEASRLNAVEVALQEQFARDLADMKLRLQADADMSNKWDAVMLRRLQQDLADAKGTLADQEAERTRLQNQMERLQRKSETEISAAKETAELRAAEILQDAQARWQQDAAKALAAVTGRWEAAEAALVSARATDARADWEAERAQFLEQLERLRRESEAQISAVKTAAEAQATERLQNAHAEWQQDAAKALANVAARWEAAEAALARATDGLANREAERTQFQDQLDRLRRESEAKISAAKAAAEAQAAERLQDAQAKWRQDTAKTFAELTARWEAAEAALASARARDSRGDPEPAQSQFQDQLERLQRKSEAEIAAVKAAAELGAAEMLRAAETAWQERVAGPLAELAARCQAAEAALAEARATNTNWETERSQFQDQLEHLRQKSETEIAAVKETAEINAAETVRAAEAAWQERAVGPLAEVTARCQAAEMALEAAACAASASKSNDDAYVRSLNLEIKSLQKTLVDREADLAQARASMEQMRLGIAVETPASSIVVETPGNRWHPLQGGGLRDTLVEAPAESHLVRDVLVVFAVVIAVILSLPRIEPFLPDDLRAQIATVGGLFDTQEQKIVAPAPPAPAAAPKPEHPMAIVARAVNMRAEPAMAAAVLVSLNLGAKVAILEKSGNWDRVEISGADGKVQQGWVYGSYLSEAGAPG